MKYAAFHFTSGPWGDLGVRGFTTIEGRGLTEDMARRIQKVLHGDRWATSFKDDALWRETVYRMELERVEHIQITR